VAGLAVLLGPKALTGVGASGDAAMELLGGGALALCAFTYAWGEPPRLRRKLVSLRQAAMVAGSSSA
jgi:hypothetical protein